MTAWETKQLKICSSVQWLEKNNTLHALQIILEVKNTKKYKNTVHAMWTMLYVHSTAGHHRRNSAITECSSTLPSNRRAGMLQHVIAYIDNMPSSGWHTHSVVCLRHVEYTRWVKKKQDTKLLPITSPNINRFSQFFYWQTQWCGGILKFDFIVNLTLSLPVK